MIVIGDDDNAPERKMRGKHWPLSVATHSPSNGIYYEDGNVDDINWHKMMTMSIVIYDNNASMTDTLRNKDVKYTQAETRKQMIHQQIIDTQVCIFHLCSLYNGSNRQLFVLM